jgi:indole-3-glycerol phosphate synthase
MKNPPAILGKITASTHLRVKTAKENLSPERARQMAVELAEEGKEDKTVSFEQALSTPDISFICEVKKASPSKGIISQDFPWLEIAKDYEEAGAAAISVLTEPEFFLGSDRYLREISKTVSIPTLRKDFIIDPYQIYEAKIWGAKAVLLICALLEQETLALYLAIAKELSLDCLVEIHSEEEADEAIRAGSRIIGINNRDLTTFNVDTSLTKRLKKLLPSGIITVAESGIQSADEVKELRDIGVNAVLIGESLMKSGDRKAFLRELKK